MEFARPKLKRKKNASLPGQVSEEEQREKDGQKCTGVLMGHSVFIHSESDVSTLQRLGCYGRGIFSRGRPAPRTSTRGASSSECSREGAVKGAPACRKRGRGSQRWSELEPTECCHGEGEEEEKRRKLSGGGEQSQERQKLVDTEIDNQGSSKTKDGEFCSVGQVSTVVISCGEDGAVIESGVLRPIESVVAPVTHKLTEPLCLTAEEVLYLTAEVRILSVTLPLPNSPTHTLTPSQLWQSFCKETQRFPFTYAVYRHYRRKGWVVKPGLKFGVDFLLYKDGPDSYHSSYAVLVCDSFAERETELSVGTISSECEQPQKLRWMDAIAHCRVCESTAKELVLACVEAPAECGEAQLTSAPEMVDCVSISEVLLTRWIPERDRQ